MNESKFIKFICNRLTEQLDIIDNSSDGELTDFQSGYVSAINFVLDLIINYKGKPTPGKPIKEGFKLFQKKPKTETPTNNERREKRYTYKRP